MASVALDNQPAVQGNSAAILGDIQIPHVAIAIWNRANPCPDAAAEPGQSIDITVDAGAVEAALHAALTEAGYRASADALHRDIVDRATEVVTLTDATQLRIRLDRVNGNACKLFHADYVTIRLLCTYAGTGTQWRHATDELVYQLAPGDVALLKGRVAMPEPAILHRSPPIEGTGETRVLLAIDPVGHHGRQQIA